MPFTAEMWTPFVASVDSLYIHPSSSQYTGHEVTLKMRPKASVYLGMQYFSMAGFYIIVPC